METTRVISLLEVGELFELMVAATREWAQRTHPDAEYAAICIHIKDGVPDDVTPILPARRSSPLLPFSLS